MTNLPYIAKYVRDENRNPTGLLVILRDTDGQIKAGWSACANGDRFNKVKAQDIAVNRALKGSVTPMPFRIKALFNDQLRQRCQKYFRQEVINI